MHTFLNRFPSGFFVIERPAIFIWWCLVVSCLSPPTIWLPSILVECIRLVNKFFSYVASSLLLTTGPDIWSHKRTVFAGVSWSETDTTLLRVTIIETGVIFGCSLRCGLLLYSSNLLRLLCEFLKIVFRTPVFRRGRLFDENGDKLESRSSILIIIGLFPTYPVNVLAFDGHCGCYG